MTEKRISQRYAKALFLIAQEEKTMETIYNDVLYIQKVLKSSRALRLMLNNPIISPYKKIRVFNDIFKESVQPITLRFLVFLVEKNREDLLSNIILEFIDMYNTLNNLLEVEIVSAIELNDAIRKEVISNVANMTNKTILPKFIINPKIIGGIQLKFDDYLYDASLKKQLENLNYILTN